MGPVGQPGPAVSTDLICELVPGSVEANANG